MEKQDSKRTRISRRMSGESVRSPSHSVNGFNDSVVLKSILSQHDITWDEFLNDIWQTRQYRFVMKNSEISALTSNSAVQLADADAGRWRDEHMCEDPWKEMILQGWYILADILETSQRTLSVARKKELRGQAVEEHEIPLIFQDQTVKSWEEIEEVYGTTSLFATYLDGCSIVFNHADLLNPYLAFLCQDLQQKGGVGSSGFPHVYANCYLTPPQSQTAPPHADDRDVLIFQLVGQKQWQVYSQVPIPFPYPHEQVGKDGLRVPHSVLNGPKAFEGTLCPGDVLYLPRGMVHQAQSTNGSLSFHITVAIATHDWTVAGNLNRQIQTRLMRTKDFRRSILPFGSTNRGAVAARIQNDIDQVLQAIQEEITAESMLHDIESRIDEHNRRSFSDRMTLIHSARVSGGIDHAVSESRKSNLTTESSMMDRVVGPLAAIGVKYTTRVRAATVSERTFAQGRIVSNKKVGLLVREEIADAVMEIVDRVKASENTNKTFQVTELASLVENRNHLICGVSLLSLAKRAIELGAFAISTSDRGQES